MYTQVHMLGTSKQRTRKILLRSKCDYVTNMWLNSHCCILIQQWCWGGVPQNLHHRHGGGTDGQACSQPSLPDSNREEHWGQNMTGKSTPHVRRLFHRTVYYHISNKDQR